MGAKGRTKGSRTAVRAVEGAAHAAGGDLPAVLRRAGAWLGERLRRLDPAVVGAANERVVAPPAWPEHGRARATLLSAFVVASTGATSPEEAERAYRLGLDLARDRSDARLLLRLHATAAELRALRGDLAAAREALSAGEAIAQASGGLPAAYLLLARGAVLEAEGAGQPAYGAYRAAATAASSAGARHEQIKALILAAHVAPEPDELDTMLRPALRALAQEGYRDFLAQRPAVVDWLRERASRYDLSPAEVATLNALLAPEPAATVSALPARTADGRRLEVGVLGPFEVRYGDSVLGADGWRTAKAKELFALLALNGDLGLQRDELSERLWPDSEAASSVSKFHFTLHQLRKELAAAGLGAEVSVARSGSIYRLLLPAGAVLDFDEFERAMREARAARREGRPLAAMGKLREALSRVRGPFLSDLKGPWLEERREQLERVFASAGRELADLELAGGEALAAITTCQQVIEREPYDEGSHRLLMRAYQQAGDTALALGHYQALERLLRRELSEEPETATRELYLLLKRQSARS